MNSRFSFRRTYSSLVSGAGLAALQRWRERRRVAILTYHDIAAPVFAAHLEFVARAYHIIPLSEAVAGLQGKSTLPERPLALTFDDGFRSFYSNVFPALQRAQAPATVFLTTGFVGSSDILWFSWLDLAFKTNAQIGDLLPRPLQGMEKPELRRALTPYLKRAPDEERLHIVHEIRQRVTASDDQISRYRLLRWDEVREMQASGLVAFGGHTLTHPILARASLDKARHEITGCAADLERELGRQTRHFAYPNGELADFNEQIKEMVRQAGFASAVSASRGTCAAGDDLYALRRIGVDGSFSVAELDAKLSGLWVHLGRGGM